MQNRFLITAKILHNMITNMKCEPSAQYSSDELHILHFHCNFCGEEMSYNEDRECTAEPEKCVCGALIGDDDMSVGCCINCGRKI